jgi:hypothetical protein
MVMIVDIYLIIRLDDSYIGVVSTGMETLIHNHEARNIES